MNKQFLRNLRLLSIVFVVFVSVSLQKTTGQEAKFKKVSNELLLKEASLIEEDASAEYLHRSCEVDFKYNQTESRFELVYSYFFRIKVYDDSDLSEVNRSIRYYIGSTNNSEDEKIESIEGYTFNLEDGKVKKEKLKKENIYIEEENKYWAKCNFAMPAVKKGSVIDLKYKLRSIYLNNIDKFYLQQDQPVVYADLTAYIPEYFNYSNVSSGFLPVEVGTTTRRDKLRIRQKAKRNDATNFYSSSSQTKDRDIEVDYTTYVKRFTATSIPSLVEEPYVNNMNNYKSGIGFELMSTQYPGATIKFYSENWNDIGKVIYDENNFGGEIKKDFKFDAFLNEIQNNSDLEKVKKIYAKVQGDYSWNSYYSARSADGIKKMLSTGTGNSAEINLLLINLLKRSGVTCNPVLMRNRYSGALNINYPTKSDLNYVIAQVDVGGKLIYLDATDKNLVAGELPPRAINRDGVVINENGGTQTLVVNSNKSLVSTVQELNIIDNEIVGTIERKYKKYSAYKLHSQYKSDDDFISAFNKDGSVNISDVSITGLAEQTGDIAVVGKVEYKTYTQTIDGKIFLDYALDIIPEASPFKQEERQYALFFDSKVTDINIIKYNIPEGYKIEFVPEDFSIALPGRLMMNVVEFMVADNQVVVTIRESRKTDILTPEYYLGIKEFYGKFVEKKLDKIIFAKQ